MGELLQKVITAHHCRSTHHFFVISALDLLKGPMAGEWQKLLLWQHAELLRGAKAPDKEFKDFKNHVLHVSENEWGGACEAATEWYWKAVDALALHRWDEAAFALGVMSHYYADPIQPFHTAQSEEENAIHRALEWSITKSRPEILRRVRHKGYPKVELPGSEDCVADMVRAGAQRSHVHYQTLIDHYDVDRGVKDPPAGLDDTLLDIIAELTAYATSGIAALFDSAVRAAKVEPRRVDLTLQGYLSTLDIPVRWVLKRIDDADARREVEAMYRELNSRGKVLRTLAEDDKAVRRRHAVEVTGEDLDELDARPLKPIGTRHGEPRYGRKPVMVPVAQPPVVVDVEENATDVLIEETVSAPQPTATVTDPPKETETSETSGTTDADASLPGMDEAETVEDTHAQEPDAEPVAPKLTIVPPPPAETPDWTDNSLHLAAPVEAAPSIGAKTAARLQVAGVVTISDLLEADVDVVSETLNVRHITPDTLRLWQQQTQLMLEVPGLRVHDAQILVGIGIMSAQDLAEASATYLLNASVAFVADGGKQFRLRDSDAPDAEEIDHWIGLARDVG